MGAKKLTEMTPDELHKARTDLPEMEEPGCYTLRYGDMEVAFSKETPVQEAAEAMRRAAFITSTRAWLKSVEFGHKFSPLTNQCDLCGMAEKAYHSERPDDRVACDGFLRTQTPPRHPALAPARPRFEPASPG